MATSGVGDLGHCTARATRKAARSAAPSPVFVQNTGALVRARTTGAPSARTCPPGAAAAPFLLRGGALMETRRA